MYADDNPINDIMQIILLIRIIFSTINKNILQNAWTLLRWTM